jgi:ankyrin repeat protein
MSTILSSAIPTLHDAVARGDIETLTRLLEAGGDVYQRDEKDRSLLFLAVREAVPLAVVHLLLDHGADVNERSGRMGLTPLMAAASLVADADVSSGDTSSSLVRLLLARGADVNALATNGAGALARAVVAGNETMVRLLLDAGADPKGGVLAPANTAPLWAAVALKQRSLVALLISRGADVNTGNSVIGTPFTIAVTGGDVEIARLLLEAGADPNRPSLVNLPLLAVALRLQNPPMAQLLEQHGLSLVAAS